MIYLYVCYWPGLLEDCSSRPGSVCGIVSRESIVGGTKGERKSESKLVVFVLNFTKEKKKGRGGIMIKKESRTKKILPYSYDSFSNREYVCRVLTPCLKRGAHTTRRRTSSKTTSVVVVRKKERGGGIFRNVGDESNKRDESCVLTPANLRFDGG